LYEYNNIANSTWLFLLLRQIPYVPPNQGCLFCG
jgi:hypothetical protein